MKHFKLLICLLIFLSSAVLCQRIISHSLSNQRLKQDYSEINHIKYGLFSVNQWKEKLSEIVSAEISNFDLSRSNEKMLKKHIEAQLSGLIDNVVERIEKSNEKSFGGRIKQRIMNVFVDIKNIKEGIPQYADTIMKEMTKKKTEKKLKGALKEKVDYYLDSTFEIQDLSVVNSIVARVGAKDIESAKKIIDYKIESNRRRIFHETWILIALCTLLFALVGFSRHAMPATQYILLLLTLLMLLFAGVTTPMIDLEAKISEMSFVLLDHPIGFHNQVLYFQSKSVLDVFWIMYGDDKLQMQIVGLLMVLFSIVFPLLKIISSLFYYYDYRNLRENKVVQFFVLKSGKWSMSDVLVISIFMAYIGFNGVITDQFGKVDMASQDVVLLTTNGTALQPGFYIFLAYTLLALFLSGFLKRKAQPHAAAQPAGAELTVT